MLIQSDNWRCGPHAIVNACLALGHEHSLGEVTTLARTTRAGGTDERGVIAALTEMEYTALPMTARGPDLWLYVFTALNAGDPVILCVDDEDHWVAVVGVIGARLVIFDSERTLDNVNANGVHIYDETQFTTRLGSSRYAIRVGEQPEQKDSLGNDISDEITAQLTGVSFKDLNQDRWSDSESGGKIAGLPDTLTDYVLGGRR